MRGSSRASRSRIADGTLLTFQAGEKLKIVDHAITVELAVLHHLDLHRLLHFAEIVEAQLANRGRELVGADPSRTALPSLPALRKLSIATVIAALPDAPTMSTRSLKVFS